MQFMHSLLSAGAFNTPIPWQAEISFLVFIALLVYAPSLLDSIRGYRRDSHRKGPRYRQPYKHRHNEED